MPNRSGSDAATLESFEGFELLFYTQIPDVFFDHVMRHLTSAELLVILFIMRHTFGWKKESDRIALTQICDGLKKDGRVIEEGTGLARTSAVRAIRGLEEKGLIVANRETYPSRKSGKPMRGITTYSLRMKGQANSGSITLPAKNEHGATRKKVHGATRAVASCYPQETKIQETIEQETPDPLAIRLCHLLNACKPDDRAEVRAHLAELGNGERVGRAIGRAEMEWDRRKGPREFWQRVEWWLENGG